LEAEEGLGYVIVDSLNVLGYIYFKAGSGIQAGAGIKAGEGIEAGWGIKAGWGIQAGLSITCKKLIVCTVAVFAGVCYWRNISEEEMTISCAKLEGAPVKYGILKETGLEEDNESKKKATELRKKADELLAQSKELEASL
jgi:hypothetical protein